MPRTRLYGNGSVQAEDFGVDAIEGHLRDAPDAYVWLDLTSPSHAELRRVQQELGVHRLAVEDVASPHERPKLTHYEGHLFVTAYAVRFDGRSGEVDVCRVSAFVMPRVLVTVHDETFDIDAVTARWDETADLAGHGVAYLLHGLLDVIVDGHFDAVQGLDDALEALEEQLFDERRDSVHAVQRRTFRLRRCLTHVRKLALPMRQVVGGLQRGPLAEGSMAPYFQDLDDHVLRVAEWTDSLRDFVATLLDTNLAVQGNRMNNIMKKVTSWAAIIAVPAAVTGYYGQNIPFPGHDSRAGFLTSAALIVVLSAGLYATFKRKDWL